MATGSEPATYTFALGSARGASGAIVAYSGVDPSNPIDDSQAQQNANGTTITAPSVSASTSGGMLVALYGVTVVTSIGQPAGMTERGEVSNSIFAKATTTEVSDQALVASGLTGARTASHGGGEPAGPTSDGWWCSALRRRTQKQAVEHRSKRGGRRPSPDLERPRLSWAAVPPMSCLA